MHRTDEADLQEAQQLLQRPGTPGRPPAALPARNGGAAPAPHRPTSVYAAVFYPGTTTEANAEAIKLNIGEERSGVDFAIQLVPTAWVEGTVANPSGALPPNLEIRLLSVTQGVPSTIPNFASLLPTRPKPDGSFSFNGVSPGQYVVVATTGAAGRGAPPTSGLWATSEVSVNGADVSGVALSLQPGMTFSGRVVFDGTTATPPADLTTVRVSLAPALSGSQVTVGQLSTQATKDGTFTLTGLMPGRYMLRAIPAATEARAGWVVRSAVVHGRDASDDPFELHGGDAIGDAVITFTDQTCELNGTLQDCVRPASVRLLHHHVSCRSRVVEADRQTNPAGSPSERWQVHRPQSAARQLPGGRIDGRRARPVVRSGVPRAARRVCDQGLTDRRRKENSRHPDQVSREVRRVRQVRRVHYLKIPSIFNSPIRIIAPTTDTIHVPMPSAAIPSIGASQPPIPAPTMPTTTFAIMPICAFVFMTMLASQPTIPPTINWSRRFIASSFGRLQRSI